MHEWLFTVCQSEFMAERMTGGGGEKLDGWRKTQAAASLINLNDDANMEQ